MNKNITEAKVWRKFKKAVETDGFLFVEASDKFKNMVYENFLEEYKRAPITVEAFAKVYMVHINKMPMRSIDNSKPMNSSS